MGVPPFWVSSPAHMGREERFLRIQRFVAEPFWSIKAEFLKARARAPGPAPRRDAVVFVSAFIFGFLEIRRLSFWVLVFPMWRPKARGAKLGTAHHLSTSRLGMDGNAPQRDAVRILRASSSFGSPILLAEPALRPWCWAVFERDGSQLAQNGSGTAVYMGITF